MQPREMAEDLWGDDRPLRLEQGPLQGAPAWEQSQAQDWGFPPPPTYSGSSPCPGEVGTVGRVLCMTTVERSRRQAPPILPMPRGPLMAGA